MEPKENYSEKASELVFALIFNMKTNGWINESPSKEGEKIDREVCKESSCKKCASPGMAYEPFTKGEHYRAFAICRDCGNSEEF